MLPVVVKKMENGVNELENDEFEKLLGEIPNVTSGNSYSEESGVINCPKDINLTSSNGDGSKLIGVTETYMSNEIILGKLKEFCNRVEQLPNKRFESEEINLPNEQAIASAFAELRVKEGAFSAPMANSTPLLDHLAVVNGQCKNSLGKIPSNLDSQVLVVPSPRTPNNLSSSFNGFSPSIGGHQSGYVHTMENISAAVALPPGVPGVHLLPPIHRVDIPVISNQQHFFLDVTSPVPYFHSQIKRHHGPCRHIEEEQHYFLYMQQLHAQQLDNQYPIQLNGSITSRSINSSSRQPFSEMPIPHFNQQVSRSINPLSSLFCSMGSDVLQGLDKTDKQYIPERMLRRSHGPEPVKSAKFGSFGGTNYLSNMNRNRRVFPNAYSKRSFHSPSAESRLDCLESRSFSPDVVDLKFHRWSQSREYNLIDDFAGRIFLMAKDQNGCRFLQRKFAEGSSEDVEKIFPEIIVHIVELMIDPFGNYLVQKLLEVCNEGQRMQILRSITRIAGDLVRISCDMHGTRAVQKVIETLKTPEQFSMIVSSLKPGLVNLIKDMNGNHVAQRCLQYLTPEYKEFLFEAAITNCVELATDRHGCCVLQKCLSQSDGGQRNRLIYEITSNALVLSQDPFGNYVVQYIFDIRLSWATTNIFDQVRGKFGDLSMQKYSSNVVEKCLKHVDEERSSYIIEELLSDPRLDQIMQDPYGNYVIQAALNISKGTLHTALVEAVRAHVPVLRTSPYGKKVLSCNSLKK
ncbi:pumilio homolog 12 [Solanum lycopersicum]|uniref:PUM-HD domain-containing protein n=1 Tax=Solanum lycopersicum TaxID=4081 RepID=A0A3Q7ECW9_SOLLC|nr:pumilio homolog 12 [Solanum lycopersicum]XP_010318119.1 pumilio homolog 12 [Solanum lycopersicum]XP_019069972.1 pumilio homolog 12 [Solanum lycopersicum]XP_019069973.1 pumilio homolog 12 [Solanum lycopersicum]